MVTMMLTRQSEIVEHHLALAGFLQLNCPENSEKGFQKTILLHMISLTHRGSKNKYILGCVLFPHRYGIHETILDCEVVGSSAVPRLTVIGSSTVPHLCVRKQYSPTPDCDRKHYSSTPVWQESVQSHTCVVGSSTVSHLTV